MVTADPPSDTGAVNTTTTDARPGVAETTTGAPGVVRGVTDANPLATPAPAAFTARNPTEYDVPLDKPVITTGLTVDAGDTATHEDPPSVVY